MFIFISEMQPTFGEAKVRISEKKTKFYLGFLERKYLNGFTNRLAARATDIGSVRCRY